MKKLFTLFISLFFSIAVLQSQIIQLHNSCIESLFSYKDTVESKFSVDCNDGFKLTAYYDNGVIVCFKIIYTDSTAGYDFVNQFCTKYKHDFYKLSYKNDEYICINDPILKVIYITQKDNIVIED